MKTLLTVALYTAIVLLALMAVKQHVSAGIFIPDFTLGFCLATLARR